MSALREARDFLLAHRDDYDTAYREFRQPELEAFNWALDWFDVLAAEGGERPALWIVEHDGSEARRTFAELSARSNQVANWLREQGVARGDRIIVMLGNQVELWETILAAMKLGAVIIPATPLLGPADLVDRVERGDARHVVVSAPHAGKFDDVPGDYTRIAVGEPVDGWLGYADAASARDRRSPPTGRPPRRTRCCSTSPPARRPSRSWSSTPTPPIPSGTSRRCTGSGCSRATCTSTSPPRAGPSTRGATSTRRGSPRRA